VDGRGARDAGTGSGHPHAVGTTLAEELVAWAWSGSADAAPPRVRHAAARHVLDGVGCALAAARRDAIPAALTVARELGVGDTATVIGGGRLAPAAAALANGALIHALDFDDTHADALVHATAAVLPAALASAEEAGASGAALLSACVAGYEVVARLGAAVRHGFHARGFHATSTVGVFAAALVAARLQGLPERTAVAALGIAGSMAGGTLEFLADGSETKQLHPGLAAHAGILATRLAAAGARGPATVLEGAHGLYRAYTGTAVEPEAVLAGLGERWETTRITIKPYPVCQLSHAALDAVATIADDVDAAAVERIDVDVPADSMAVVCEPIRAKVAPRSPYDAKFSLPWCLAARLLDGRLSLDTFDAVQLERLDVRELASRVRVTVFEPDVAAADAPGRVVVTHRDGRAVEGSVPASSGGPARPLDDDALRAKLQGNVGAEERAAALGDMILALDELPSLEALAPLLDHPLSGQPSR
jgi:2-methylcitrate dehydratase PrpD